MRSIANHVNNVSDHEVITSEQREPLLVSITCTLSHAVTTVEVSVINLANDIINQWVCILHIIKYIHLKFLINVQWIANCTFYLKFIYLTFLFKFSGNLKKKQKKHVLLNDTATCKMIIISLLKL